MYKGIVKRKLKGAASLFAKESGVSPHEIKIDIAFNAETGDPHYSYCVLTTDDTGKKKWVKKRNATLDEIV